MPSPAHPAPLVADVDTARGLVAALANEPVEVAEALYLDPKWRLLARQRFAGTRGGVMVPVRALVIAGLAAAATGIVLAHNHPSGDAEPSDGDIRFTRRLVDTLRLLDMPLADHLIVTRERITSMRESGLL